MQKLKENKMHFIRFFMHFYRQKMMTMMKDEKLRTQILKEIWNVLLRCIHFNELKKFLFCYNIYMYI